MRTLANVKSGSAIVLALTLAACAFAEGPTVADSHLSAVPREKGRLYFYRTYNYLGSGVAPEVTVDNDPIGPLAMNGVLYCDLVPGTYVVNRRWHGELDRPLAVTLKAGEATYVNGNLGRLTLADSQAGKSEIQSLHLSPAVCPSAQAKASNDGAPQVDEVLARGNDAEQRGDFAAALSIYTEVLRKYVTRLDAVPDVVDRAIDAALRIRPMPPIPASAKTSAATAVSAIKSARTRADLAIARREYADALATAPWWADVWYNLAKLDEQLGNAANVRRDLTWYLRSAPDAPDSELVRRQLDGLR